MKGPTHLEQVCALWIEEISLYTKEQLTDGQLERYAELTSQFSIETLETLFKRHATSPRGIFEPSPSSLIKAFEEGVNLPSQDDAVSMATEIWQAMINFGSKSYSEKEAEEKAKLAKGALCDISWKFVERNGGWSDLCQTTGLSTANSPNRETWLAQTREQIKSVIRVSNESILEEVKGLPKMDLEKIRLEKGFEDFNKIGWKMPKTKGKDNE